MEASGWSREALCGRLDGNSPDDFGNGSAGASGRRREALRGANGNAPAGPVKLASAGNAFELIDSAVASGGADVIPGKPVGRYSRGSGSSGVTSGESCDCNTKSS